MDQNCNISSLLLFPFRILGPTLLSPGDFETTFSRRFWRNIGTSPGLIRGHVTNRSKMADIPIYQILSQQIGFNLYTQLFIKCWSTEITEYLSWELREQRMEHLHFKNKTKTRKFLCPKSLIPKIFLKFDTSSTLSFSAESNDGL